MQIRIGVKSREESIGAQKALFALGYHFWEGKSDVIDVEMVALYVDTETKEITWSNLK